MKMPLLTLALAASAAGVLGAQQMPGTAAKQAARNVAAQASARAEATPDEQAPAATPAPVKQQSMAAAKPAPVKQQGARAVASSTPADRPAGAPASVKKGRGAKRSAAKDAAAAAAPGADGAAAATRPVPKDTVVPRVIMREAYTYDKGGRRDPFASLMASSDLRPAISDLRLTGILYDLSGRRPVAIMRDLITKAQYRVTTGMTLGRMRVAQIKPKVVVFSIEEFGLNRQDSLMLGDSTKVRTK